jgi:hypothetical protein
LDTKSFSFVSAFDEAWHIGKNKTSAVFEIANAKVRNQGRERVISGWDISFANDIEESRFANAWETDKTGIGKEFEFKDQTFLLTWMSVLGDAWDSMTGRFEAGIESNFWCCSNDELIL